jgi:hypothetical protein
MLQGDYESLCARERELLRLSALLGAGGCAPKTPDLVFARLRRSRAVHSLAFLVTDASFARSHLEFSRHDRLYSGPSYQV